MHTADTSRHAVVVVVADTVGFSQWGNMLTLANDSVATGILSQDEIRALARQRSVTFIDTPQRFSPNTTKRMR